MIKKHKIGFMTLGCKVNQYESEALAELLELSGFITSDASPDCDAFIVNTCTVTSEADRKSCQMIRRLHSINPKSPIIVTGCTAQRNPKRVSNIPGVSGVFGNAEKALCVKFLIDYFGQELQNQSFQIIDVKPLESADYEPLKINSFPRTRQYIKIEDGCENRCAYCAIPDARGPVRSRAPEAIVEEAKRLISVGCKEIVLTGIETASYGRDLKNTDLITLLQRIDQVCGTTRIRLGSLEPSLFKTDFIDSISKIKSICPHFHLSVQSGSSHVLALMRRKYNAGQLRDVILNTRKAMPGIMFTADVITGFPGETNNDFEETRSFLYESLFLNVHVFPFSVREGTEAACMPNQIPKEEKKKRVTILKHDADIIKAEILSSFISNNNLVQVLFESFENGYAIGHSPEYIEFKVKSEKNLHGEVLDIIPKTTDGKTVFGVLA